MRASISVALFAALSIAACGSDDDSGGNGGSAGATGGPIDGTWRVTEFTCDGTPSLPPGAEFTLTVDDASGTFVQAFTPACVATLDEEYEYPDAQTFRIKPQTIACEPNTDCPMLFMGADCPPLPPTVDFSYSRDGDTLEFTRTAAGPEDAPCMPGQAVRFVMAKQ